MLLLIIKLLGAVLSALFGAYGIGIETRNDDGSLTPGGRIAVVGLTVGSLVTITTTVIEQHQSASAAKAEIQRYERLMRVQYYSLTTRDARLDLEASIEIDGLRTVDPAYAQRLELAFDHTLHCKDTETQYPFETAHEYDCGDYMVEDDKLSPKVLTFKSSSTLFPNDKTEPYARALLNWIGVAVILGEEQTRGSGEQAKLLIQTGKYYQNISYSFYGDSLRLAIHGFPLDPSLLERANFSSMKDVVDHKTVTIIPNLTPQHCPLEPDPIPRRCENFKSALEKSVSISRLAIKFPHRHNIIFDPTWGRMDFAKHEPSKDEKHVRYVYTAPASVDDLPVSDRSQIGSD